VFELQVQQIESGISLANVVKFLTGLRVIGRFALASWLFILGRVYRVQCLPHPISHRQLLRLPALKHLM